MHCYYRKVLSQSASCLLLILQTISAGTTPVSNANAMPEQQNQIRKDQAREGEFLIDTVVSFAPAGGNQRHPAVSFNGVTFLVAWEDNRIDDMYDIYAARTNSSGTVLDSLGIGVARTSEEQWDAAISCGGLNFFVVWQDKRNGNDYDIFGSRINSSGTVIDTIGIPIAIAPDAQIHPKIAFDGTNYLVVWADARNGGDMDIYGARVSQSGVVLDPSGIVIATAPNEQNGPAVAFGGSNYLVIWSDRRDGGPPDVYGARVNPSGVVLDTIAVAISTAAYGQWAPAITFCGNNYLAVWEDDRNYPNGDRDIYGTRIDLAGVVLDPSGIAISTANENQYNPTATHNGTECLIAWQDCRNDYPNSDIYCARINGPGTILDPSGIVVTHRSSMCPSVAFDGTNYLVTWSDYAGPTYADIYGARMNQSGIVLDSSGILIAGAANTQGAPAAAFDGANYMTLWEDYRLNSSYDIYGSRISQSGVILDPNSIPISVAPNEQRRPSLAYNTNYFSAWEDSRFGSYPQIYGARLTNTGDLLDTNGIAISTEWIDLTQPRVSADSTNYFVAWLNSGCSDLHGVRVDHLGGVLPPVTSIGASPDYFSIVYTGTNYFIVWADVQGGVDTDVYGARVNQGGVLIDTVAITISALPGVEERCPSISFDGTNYFVVWQSSQNGWDIRGAKVSQDGLIIDTFTVYALPGDQLLPVVAFDGTAYVVVWQDYRSGYEYDIYGAKINTESIVIDTFPVSCQPGDQIAPALARGDGNHLLIVWSGWTDSINGRMANTMRIWGKLYPFTCVEETNSSPFSYTTLALIACPNPFRQKTMIKCRSLSNEQQKMGSQVAATIYDVTGKLIKNLLLLGSYSPRIVDAGATWYGDDCFGEPVPPGVYFVRVKTGNISKTEKIVLLK